MKLTSILLLFFTLAVAGVDVANDARFVDDERGRHLRWLVGIGSAVLFVPDDRELHIGELDKLFEFGLVSVFLVNADCEYSKVTAELIDELLVLRKRLLAGAAIRGPEVDDGDLAAGFFYGLRSFAADSLRGEIGSRLADGGQFVQCTWRRRSNLFFLSLAYPPIAGLYTKEKCFIYYLAFCRTCFTIRNESHMDIRCYSCRSV